MSVTLRLLELIMKRSPLSDMVQKVQAIHHDMLGEVIEDYGAIERRKDLTGAPLETSAIRTERQGKPMIFLRFSTQLSGSHESVSYPIGPSGQQALQKILRRDDDALFSRYIQEADRKRPQTALGRFWKWFKEGVPGEVLHDFGQIEDLNLQASQPDIPQWRWSQQTSALATRKKGEPLLVLRLDYRGPGKSGREYFPFGEGARQKLREILADTR